jgi:hypothetical protein
MDSSLMVMPIALQASEDQNTGSVGCAASKELTSQPAVVRDVQISKIPVLDSTLVRCFTASKAQASNPQLAHLIGD